MSNRDGLDAAWEGQRVVQEAAAGFDWKAGVLLACIGQSLILAVALWRAEAGSSGRWLSGALLAMSGMMSVYALGWRGLAEPSDALVFLPINLPLALGPALYGYVRARSDRPLGRKALLHLGPAALQLAYLLVLSAWPPAGRHVWREGAHDHLIKPLIEWAVVVSLAGYAGAGLRQLRATRERLRQERSDADLHDARWLAWLLGALLATLAALVGIRLYTSLVGELDAGVFQLWLGVFAVWLGVWGWRDASLRRPALPPAAVTPARETRDWKAQGALWRDQTEAAGWWREPDLTLTGLARRLGTNTAYLSRAINEGLAVNFNEMVNLMRAREVARAIEAGELAEGDLLDGALAAGFSSKATFNRAFRAATGVSPSTYRRRLRP